MLAFHSSQEIKDKYIGRVRAHREAERLTQGIGWDETDEGQKGCAVGCTLEAYDHALYPVELGIPEELARLEDCIFEGLPVVDAQAWPERFLSSVRAGADLRQVWSRFALWLLEVELKDYKTSAPVAALYRRRLNNDEPTREEWKAARAAAWAAWVGAAAAAWAASAAWAAASASAAARAAAWAAASAAEAEAEASWAASAAASAAARTSAWKRYADKLIELLEAA